MLQHCLFGHVWVGNVRLPEFGSTLFCTRCMESDHVSASSRCWGDTCELPQTNRSRRFSWLYQEHSQLICKYRMVLDCTPPALFLFNPFHGAESCYDLSMVNANHHEYCLFHYWEHDRGKTTCGRVWRGIPSVPAASPFHYTQEYTAIIKYVERFL